MLRGRRQPRCKVTTESRRIIAEGMRKGVDSAAVCWLITSWVCQSSAWKVPTTCTIIPYFGCPRGSLSISKNDFVNHTIISVSSSRPDVSHRLCVPRRPVAAADSSRINIQCPLVGAGTRRTSADSSRFTPSNSFGGLFYALWLLLQRAPTLRQNLLPTEIPLKPRVSRCGSASRDSVHQYLAPHAAT